jgi:hypothetical protein
MRLAHPRFFITRLGGAYFNACESLEDSVKNYKMVATRKSLESVSLTALARCTSLILAGQSFDHEI